MISRSANFWRNPSGVVVPPAPIAGFGTGSDAGTYVVNLWTPGRDGAGVVNQSSYDLVPSGKWSTIAGSRLDALQSAIVTAIPGWTDKGNWQGLARSWTGCAVDPASNRWWFFGGGHSDSSNNGLYRWDGYKMTWGIECLPSNSNLFSSAYANSGGYTYDERSAAAATAAGGSLGMTNDWYYDENFNDHKPTARHTYNSMVYLPDRQEVYMVCRRLWRYSIATGTWNYRRIFNDSQSFVLDGEEGFSFYDQATREVVSGSKGSSGIGNSVSINVDTLVWGSRVNPYTYFGPLAVDTSNGQSTVFSITGPDWEYSGSLGQGRLNFSGMVRADLDLTGYELPTIIYIPPLNRFWLLTLKADGTQAWFELNPTTTPWTCTPKTFTGATPAPPISGGYGGYPETGRKGMYVPAMNALVFWHDSAIEASIYKL